MGSNAYGEPVPDDALYRLPETVSLPLTEIRWVVIRLEELASRAMQPMASDLDAVIGRIVRWVWPLLGDLDDREA